jgi:hypothetical protein
MARDRRLLVEESGRDDIERSLRFEGSVDPQEKVFANGLAAKF